jgi:hypothetical protein
MGGPTVNVTPDSEKARAARDRRSWRVPAVFVAVVVIAGGLVAWRATTRGSSALPAGWVVAENQRPGTSAWRIATGSYGGVEGYANRVSAQDGDTITLYASTSAPVFHVEAYRMGWYQGLGGRLVWRSPDVPTKTQAAPTIAAVTRTVKTKWNPSTHIHISKDWVPGDYLLKLVARNGQSYVPLTVRNDASHSPVLVMNAVTTWQAYNDWGGYSLYFGPNANAKQRSTVVSFDRPYDWAIQPAIAPSNYVVCCGFLATELGVVTEVEHLGLDVSYTTDVDVQEHPAQLLRHKVLVSAGHDEYWSVAKRDAVEKARDHGLNLMFLGPNAVYWRIRLESSPLGKDRLEVNYRIAQDDPLYGKDDAQVTALWRSPPPQPRPESTLTGLMYFCFGEDNDGVVADASSWVFAGTGLKDGDHIPRLIQREADHVDKKYPTPSNIEILLHSPVACLGIDGKPVPGFFSDSTYYTAPSGAGVFASGSEWDCRLYDGCPAGPRGADRVVQRITENVLRAFAAGPAGRTHPSR